MCNTAVFHGTVGTAQGPTFSLYSHQTGRTIDYNLENLKSENFTWILVSTEIHSMKRVKAQPYCIIQKINETPSGQRKDLQKQQPDLRKGFGLWKVVQRYS